MASRRYPSMIHGGIPELDNHIKSKGKEGWKVGSELIRNLTDARLAVAKQLGITDKYPEKSLTKARPYTPATGYTKPNARKGKRSKRQQAVEIVESSPQKTMGPSQPSSRDVFDSKNRIFVLLPGIAELSFPLKVPTKTMNDVIKVVRASRRRG